ncbi:Suppressor of glycerol defect protein 1 [Zancudomyces culisetae]|uniref:Suppressor of glycerol defect protein 1 n=1 Tax=Zancudomyces culisetae TaxID=1213189 RepID=A0A1R1PKV0_ZANCU|nr:Suppressor of glycerol defect protein 1 [Zancudomyces culisetae]|eukprot:OMH81569.1 Suppressor of glycerol defect protein 1 [Zancudomyces culisetae]
MRFNSKYGKKKKNTTKLPEELVNKINAASGQANEPLKGNNKRKNKKEHESRKTKRKRERLEVKKRKRDYFSHKTNNTNTAQGSEGTGSKIDEKTRVNTIKNRNIQAKNLKEEVRSKQKIAKTHNQVDTKTQNMPNTEKKAKKVVINENVTTRNIGDSEEESESDDRYDPEEERYMRMLESKLKIKDSGKINRELEKDGLGFLLEGITVLGSKKLNKRDEKAVDIGEKNQEDESEEESEEEGDSDQDDDDDDDDEKEEEQEEESDDIYSDGSEFLDTDTRDNEAGTDTEGEEESKDAYDSEEEGYMRMLESKLKIKDSGRINKELEKDGLGFLLEGITVLGSKRLNKKDQEDVDMDNIEDDSESSGEEEEFKGFSDESNGDETDEDVHGKNSQTGTTITVKAEQNKYVPPSQRRMETNDGEKQEMIRARKAIQGLLNRVSESNIDKIIKDILEKVYGNFARKIVTDALVELVISSVESKSNLQDTFVYTNAAVIGGVSHLQSMGRNSGGGGTNECLAEFVQKLVEKVDLEIKQLSCEVPVDVSAERSQNQTENGNGNKKTAKPDDQMSHEKEEEESLGKKRQCLNKIRLLCSTYNFGMISSKLIYDFLQDIASNIGNAGNEEIIIELVLLIIKTSGLQLRKDDPARLIQLVQTVQNNSATGDHVNNTRKQFMLEQMKNLKNNRLKTQMQTSNDAILSLKKKIQNNQGVFMAAGGINVGLQDIRDVNTRGKWWLVGSAWAGNVTRDANPGSTESLDGSHEDDEEEKVLQNISASLKNLASTPTRKSILYALLTSSDYVEAFEKIAKIGNQYISTGGKNNVGGANLSVIFQKDVIRILLALVARETGGFNKYYSLVANRLCQFEYSYKITLRYCLWDYLRSIGEKSFDSDENGSTTDYYGSDDNGYGDDSYNSLGGSGANSSKSLINSINNTAKFYSHLVFKSSLNLLILKPIDFTKVCQNSILFCTLFFNSLLIHCKNKSSKRTSVSSSTPTNSGIFGSSTDKARNSLIDVELLKSFILPIEDTPHLSKGIRFFLLKYVSNNKYAEQKHLPVINECCNYFLKN